MDSKSLSPPHDNSDTKNTFRKPSGDAANRKYRRRSPVEGSSSPDGSPRHEHSSSPNPSREDSVRISQHHSQKYDGREQDRQYSRNHYGKSSESLRHSDRQSSRSSHGHSRHDKYADEDRFREKPSLRSGRESRGDHVREESDGRSKDYRRSMDKHSRDKYERSDYRSRDKDRETYVEHQKHKDMDSSYDRSGSGKRHAACDVVEERRTRDWDGRDERRDSHSAVSYSESRSQKDHPKEAYKKEQSELNGQTKDRNLRKVGEQFDVEDKDSSGKKPKFGADRDGNSGKDDDRKTSSSRLSHENKADIGATRTSGFDKGNDLDAAKFAAMRAAELVNKNLAGAGSLTTDQKKKLLWGAKKSTPTEEAGRRWDTGMFDPERQEKFNKLMGVKGEAKVEQDSNDKNGNDLVRAEKQKELQLDLEKQYTAGLRRRDGRTVGLGL